MINPFELMENKAQDEWSKDLVYRSIGLFIASKQVDEMLLN